jgi:hypothetical protein
MSQFKPLLRVTRCPCCPRTVTAQLTMADNGKWTFRPHPTDLVNGVWCAASEGRWRLRTDRGAPSGSGKWLDAWERTEE